MPLTERLGTDAAQEAPTIERGSALAAPLAPAQARIWFFEKMQPGNTLYNCADAFWVRGPLDVPALRAAFDTIVRRHEILRTAFLEEAGQPSQHVLPPSELPLAAFDVRGEPPGRRREAAKALCLREARKLYDLTAPPLARVALVTLGEHEHALMIGLHHIIRDRTAQGIIYRELAELYAAGSPARPARRCFAPASGTVSRLHSLGARPG